VRQRLKLIAFAALSAALTVAGMSIAAGGGESGGSNGDREQGLLPPKIAQLKFDQDAAEVLDQIRVAVAKKAPEIAGPIIQKAEDDGDITSDQADKLRDAAQAIADGERPDLDRSLLRDSDVRAVIHDVFEAVRDQASDIAEPIIDKAVDDGKITSDQADEIRDMLKNGPPFGLGLEFGPDGGPCGPGDVNFRAVDKDVAAVLDDIHQAADEKKPDTRSELLAIADPIIDKAVAAKKITEAQASDIRAKLRNGPGLEKGLRFHGGPPPLGAPGVAPGAFPGDAAPSLDSAGRPA
jgi:hypothetical protein